MPPPPPPPPPPAAAFKPAASADARGMLLDSIRQGRPLKKTVVNDRSSPTVSGKIPGGDSSPRIKSNNSTTTTPSGRTNGLNPPPGLAGLFAGGIPKLKSVGSASPKSYTREEHSEPSPKPTPPQPPPANQKPTSQTYREESVGVERKNSIGYGKPSVAPKPPALNSKPARPNPPPKLPNLYIPPAPPMADEVDDVSPPTPPPGVNRAQSMRLPKSASPTIPNAGAIEYRTMGRAAAKNLPPPPPRNINGVGARPRPNPLRPPSARPPPPPNKTPPIHAPPPIPSILGPPLPPHRTGPPPPPQIRHNGSLGPLPPVPQIGPPPPPTRNSSIRSIQPTVNQSNMSFTGVDLEARFCHLFFPLEDLPRPEPYNGILKTYPSKIAQSVKRQPAPQPPTQIQLGNKHWIDNTSTC